MLYAKYTKRMTKVAAFNNWLRKHKIPVIISLLLVLATVVALLGTRGIVYDSVDCPTSIEYGSYFNYQADAFMNDVAYEFRAEGETEWTTEQPTRAGKYYVRAVSSRAFGIASYGKVHEFTIVPIEVDINIADRALYGEIPAYWAYTAYDDVLTCDKFVYADLSQTETQVYADTDSIVVTDKDGNDITSSYRFNAVKSDIIFTPREIEITVEAVTFTYDGTEHSSSAWELTGGTLADGDMIVPVFDKTQTDVGEVENTPQISVTHKIISEDGFDVTANYSISQKVGMLSVQKRTVVIDSASASHEYDKTPFTCEQFTISADTPVVEGHRAEVTSSVFQIDVGTRANSLGFKMFDASGNDVTNNYNIIVNEGEIEVTPRQITIKSADDSKVYDGIALSNSSYSLENTLVPGQSILITSATSITDAGSVGNVLTADIIDADGVAVVTENYEITYMPGTLTVTPRRLTITTGDEMFFYNGREQFGTWCEIDGLMDGHAFAITDYTILKDVLYNEQGEVTGVTNAISGTVLHTNPDNYEIVTNYGSSIMMPLYITIESATNEWTYDGDAHSDPGFTRTTVVNDFVEGESLRVLSSTTVTDVAYDGENQVTNVPNVLEYDIDGGNIQNYEIVPTWGTLTITPKHVTVTSRSKVWVYDGDEHTLPEYSSRNSPDEGFVKDHRLDISSSTVVKDVVRQDDSPTGEPLSCDNVLVYTVIGTDVKLGNYDIENVWGKLRVDPLGINIWTHSAEKVYDGTPLTDNTFALTLPTTDTLPGDNAFTSTAKTFVKNERIMLDMTAALPTITHVKRDADGETVEGEKNELKFAFENVKLTNYDIEYKYGTLTINPYEAWVWTHSSEKRYTGTPLTDNTFAVTTSDTEPAGGEYTVATKTLANSSESIELDTTATLPTITHVKRGADGVTVESIQNTLKLDLIGGIESDYDITYKYGTLKINPFDVYVWTESAEKEYDGTPLTDNKFAVLTWVTIQTSMNMRVFDSSDKSLTNGEKFSIDASKALPSITDVKRGTDGKTVESIDNDIKFVVANGIMSDYDVTYDYGTLTITPIAIHITTASNGSGKNGEDEWVYNGQPHEDKNFTSDRDPITGERLLVSVWSTLTNAGTKANNLTLKVCTNDDNTDKTHNYDPTYTYGTLTVLKREVIVKTPDASKVYDDTELYNLNWAIQSSSKYDFVSGQYPYVAPGYATLTNADSIDNVLVLKVRQSSSESSEDLTDNYDIKYKYDDTKTYGTLTVTKRKITVKTPDATVVYDGTAHSAIDNITTATSSQNTVVEWHEIVANAGYTTRTDVGSSQNILTVSIVKQPAARAWTIPEYKTSNYEIEYEYGTITVTERPIKVKADSATRVYNGYPLTAGFVCVDVDDETYYELAPDQTGEIECTGSQTDFGSCSNAFVVNDLRIFDANHTDVTANYSIDYDNTPGTLTVTKRPITIASKGTEDDYQYLYGDYWIYDGTAKELKDFLITNSRDNTDEGLAKNCGSVLILSDWASITDVGQTDNVFTARIVERRDGEAERDVTHNYEITYEYGTLFVLPRPVTVLTNSRSWVYDGSAHYDEGWTVSPNSKYGFVLDHTLNVISHTEITNVGTAENVLDVELINTLTSNYELTVEYGTLQITKRLVIVSTDSQEKIYDDTALTGNGNATAENLVDGHRIVYTTIPVSVVDVNVDNPSQNLVVVDRIEDALGNDLTDNYEIEYDYGMIIVYPRPITVETASNSWEYDGIAHYDDRFEIIDGTLVVGHEMVVVYYPTIAEAHYPTITDPGMIDNTLELAIRMGDIVKTDNYDITYVYGVLIVEASDDPDPDDPPNPGPDDPDNPDYPTPTPDDAVIMRVLSDKTSYVYLRESSAGDYISGTDWGSAPEFTGSKINYNGKNYTVNYLPNVVMQNSGFESVTTQIERIYSPYAVPYFATFDASNAVMTSDVEYTSSDKEYTFTHYDYQYASDNGASLGGGLGIYGSVEQAYREFVYANYLNVSQDTREYLQSIIDRYRFRKTDPAVVASVANYIRNAAKYNMKYDAALDSEANTVIAFLDSYKEGVCRHYATAATLLFRTLGIPARYTVGVGTETKAGEWVEVKMRHAWVEVYIDGIGWMNVEVTGSGDGSPSPDPNPNPMPDDPVDPGEEKPLLVIKPVDLSVEYDGTEHRAPQQVEDVDDGNALAQLLQNGYRYYAVVSGSRTDYGMSESTIQKFFLYDADNNNVTADYNIKYEPGWIHITRTQLHICLMDLSKTYDGTPLVFEPLVFEGYEFPVHRYETPLPAGIVSVDIDYSMFAGLTDAGYLSPTELEILFEEIYQADNDFIHVYDSDGNDVAQNYSVIVDKGSLNVLPIKIVIASESASKEYDGTPLTAEDCTVIRGSLLAGHVLDVKAVGTVTEVTDSKRPVANKMTEAKIYDADGNDVTANYEIGYQFGALVVTPAAS